MQILYEKMLWILPRSWDAKRTSLEEAQYPNNLTLSHLREKLLAYELHLKTTSEIEAKVETNAEDSKKVVVFRAINDESTKDDSDDDINKFAQYLCKIIKKRCKKSINYDNYITNHAARKRI